MSTYYPAGDYWGTVTKQAMGKTKNGNAQFVLSFTVLGLVDPQDETTYVPAECQYERTMYRVITDKTVKYAVEDLEQLEISIDSWSQLDPVSPSHVSIVGSHHKFRCNHESYEGNVNEKWQLARGGEGVKVTPLEDKELRQLDAMFGKSLKSSSTKPVSKPKSQPVAEVVNNSLQDAGVPSEVPSEVADDIPF